MLILNFMMKEHENMKRFRTFRPLVRKPVMVSVGMPHAAFLKLHFLSGDNGYGQGEN